MKITLKEFNKLTKIERLYYHLLAPEDFLLTDAEEKYLEKLKAAFVLWNDCPTRTEYYAKFDALYASWRSERFKIFKDSQELFGRFEVLNKNLVRARVNEALEEALVIARKAKDVELIVKTALAYAKVNQADKPDLNTEDLTPPSEVTFIAKNREENGANRTLPEAD